MISLILVAVGGFLGSICRFWLAEQSKAIWGTWIVNITGSILLATLFKFHSSGYFSNTIWLFWGVGFAGAYTTFSTFGKETLDLILSKKYTVAARYVVTSFGLSILLVTIILT